MYNLPAFFLLYQYFNSLYIIIIECFINICIYIYITDKLN